MLCLKPGTNGWDTYLTYHNRPGPQVPCIHQSLPVIGPTWVAFLNPYSELSGTGRSSLNNPTTLVILSLCNFEPPDSWTWFFSLTSLLPSFTFLLTWHMAVCSCPLQTLSKVLASGYAPPRIYKNPSPLPYPGAVISFFYFFLLHLVPCSFLSFTFFILSSCKIITHPWENATLLRDFQRGAGICWAPASCSFQSVQLKRISCFTS